MSIERFVISKDGESGTDARLLLAAIDFGAEPELDALLKTIGEAMNGLPELKWRGLGVLDPRREVVVIYSAGGGGATGAHDGRPPFPSEGKEVGVAETEIGGYGPESPTYVSPDLANAADKDMHKRLMECGVRRYVGVALWSRGQMIGCLYAGFGTEAAPDRPTLTFLEQLARIVTPAFWNWRTHARLEKGDRRRATLTELSRAINTSLKLDEVLNAARQAIAQIEGHQMSLIALLHDGEREYRAYRQMGAGRLVPDVERGQVSDTALAWVLKHKKSYESDDLKARTQFPGDAALRDAGARRYVAAPMFVRGRIIGAMIFGMVDPHPALTTDLWLYENIALQVALAIDNARQYEQLHRLSERLSEQNVYLREEIESQHNFEEIVGTSTPMRRVFDAIARVGATEASVLILGETGVGKELVARAIHARSSRSDQPLVKINCAAIPEGLVESELFGHERGAFTSATSRRIGRFELAGDGTLFLDEIGELPLAVQAKLLRVLQDGELERVGGTQTIRTNVRIIAATNRNLLRAIELGTFRSDLYYRLNVFPIEVPSLAERREDIPMLVERFVQQYNRRTGRNVASVDAESLEYLCRREWPGNVRELQHVIERSMILCDGPVLRVERVAAVSGPPAAIKPPSIQAASLPAAPSPAPSVATLRDMEREHIERALKETAGVIEGPRGAAALLGIKASTLRFRMKRLGAKRT